jgi:YHS domain-containing protein
MKSPAIIFFSAAILCLTSCNQLSKGETKSVAPVPKKTIEINLASLAQKSDPACGMPLKQNDIADTTVYQGKVYGFCGSGCKEEFLKNPGQYLNQ